MRVHAQQVQPGAAHAAACFVALMLIASRAIAVHPTGHQVLDTTGWTDVPRVELAVSGGVNVGWDVHIRTANWRFAPENVHGFSRKNEGHAHLYVDGQKTGRIYSDWHHLGPLPPGERRIEVRLVANDHRDLTRDGRPIAASAIFHVPRGIADDHDHPDPAPEVDLAKGGAVAGVMGFVGLVAGWIAGRRSSRLSSGGRTTERLS